MISANRYCSSCGAAHPLEAVKCFVCGLSLKVTAPLDPFAPSASTPRLLQQRYHILAQVGTGGYSAVYKAEDTQMNNRLVAVKAVNLHGLKPHEAIEATETFNREILLLADLAHPNLPRVYENFSDNENWYMVMDFIEGSTLEKHLEDRHTGQLPVGEVLEIGLLLCAVLEYLHAHQPPIIFRDLKPANVMLTPDGRIALIDFGIARYFKPGQTKDTIPFGSPGYAAPEQYGKAQTTPRSDIYSLGVLLHQLLSGVDPSLSPFHLVPLPPQSPPSPVLTALETLLQQMVQLDADKRPETISVVTQELQRLTAEWSMQYTHGLKARGPYSRNQPSPAFFQALLPPNDEMDIALGGHGGGKTQMSSLQYSAPGTGSATSSSSTYSARAIPQKRYNRAAIASLVFGVLTPLFTCLSFASLMSQQPNLVYAPLQFFSLLLVPTLLILPPIMAIIFGHIGIRHAHTIHGLGESKDAAILGMILGYLFSSIYFLLIVSLLCHFFY